MTARHGSTSGSDPGRAPLLLHGFIASGLQALAMSLHLYQLLFLQRPGAHRMRVDRSLDRKTDLSLDAFAAEYALGCEVVEVCQRRSLPIAFARCKNRK